MMQRMRGRLGEPRGGPTWRLWILVLIVLLSAAILFSPGHAPGRFIARLLGGQDQVWRAMQERGAWRIGLDPSFPPFEMLDEQGVPVGYDIDLAQRMATLWGLRVDVVPMGFDSLLDALQAGKIDSVVSAMPYDPRATEDYAFSPPYFEAGVRLVTRDGAAISGVEDLHDRTVAVEWGSMGDMVGRTLQREGIALELAPFPTPEEAADALVADSSIDALMIDNISLREAQERGAPIVAVGPALESNPYVIVAPLTAHDLQEQIKQALVQLQDSGGLADMEVKWFGRAAVTE